MSTNKTENYGLHAWVAGDDFLREEMNENFAAIDLAFMGKSTLVWGGYVGSGSTGGRTIELGFAPKAVLLATADQIGSPGDGCYGGLVVVGYPMVRHNFTVCEVAENGFFLNTASHYCALDIANEKYRYIALM